jgi:hypothetical protein
MEPPARAVRFAGYPSGGQEIAVVVCEVTVDALQTLSGAMELTHNEAMGVFELHKELIFEVASAKFDEGAFRPRVTASDLNNIAA